MKPTWTKAGVRHKTPRWYWIRVCGSEPTPCRIWHDAAGGTWMADPFAVYRASLPWPDMDYERTTAPIPEPKA